MQSLEPQTFIRSENNHYNWKSTSAKSSTFDIFNRMMMRFSALKRKITLRVSGAPNDGFLQNTLKSLFRLLDLWIAS